MRDAAIRQARQGQSEATIARPGSLNGVGSRGREMAWADDEKASYRPSCINNLGCEVMILIFQHFAECVLNRGIVAVYKMTLAKPDREGGFA